MIHSGFFNSRNHDKKYYNSDLSRLFNALIIDGVFQNIGSAFVATAGSGMQVIIPTGMAYFNSTWLFNDANYPVAIDAAPVTSGYSRKDGIFLKMYPENDINTRENAIVYVPGTAGSSPSNPVPTSSDGEVYAPLCYITVAYGTTQISASMISNQVGSSGCPFVSGILNTINAQTLLTQWNASFNEFLSGKNTTFNSWMNSATSEFESWERSEHSEFESWESTQQASFEDWFEHLQDELSGDVAANLQLEIDNLSSSIGSINTVLATKVTKFSGNGYVTVDQLAYDQTNKKLGLKVNGADTVIPFSGGGSEVYIDGMLQTVDIKKIKIKSTDLYNKNDLVDLYTQYPLPYSPMYSCAVVFNNNIHLLGGSSSGTGTYHYKWNKTNGWSSVSTLPYSFNKGNAVVFNNEIHILGGYNNAKKHYKYVPSTEDTSQYIWTQLNDLPYNFVYGKALVYKGELYILGGDGSQVDRKFYKWNPTNDSWTSLGNLPTGFDRQSAIVYNNYIYMFTNSMLDSYKYNGTRWDSIPKLHEYDDYDYYTNGELVSDYWGIPAVIYNKLIIFGASDDSQQYYAKVYKPDIGWIKMPRFSSWIVNTGCGVVLDNEFYYMYSNRFYYQPKTARGTINTRVILADLPDTAAYASALCIDGAINVFGGYGSSNGTKWKIRSVKSDDSWTTQSIALPYSFQNGCAIARGGDLFIFGGSTSGYKNKCYKFISGVWTAQVNIGSTNESGGELSLDEYTYEFEYGAAVIWNGNIVLLGVKEAGEELLGGSGNSYTYKAVIYDEIIGTIKLCNMPYSNGMFKGAAVTYHNEVHIFGGTGIENRHYKLVQTDPIIENGCAWIRLADMPNNLASTSTRAVVVDDTIYVIDMYSTGRKIYKYNYPEDSWTILNTTATMPPNGADGVVVSGPDGMIYELNGYDFVAYGPVIPYDAAPIVDSIETE